MKNYIILRIHKSYNALYLANLSYPKYITQRTPCVGRTLVVGNLDSMKGKDKKKINKKFKIWKKRKKRRMLVA